MLQMHKNVINVWFIFGFPEKTTFMSIVEGHRQHFTDISHADGQTCSRNIRFMSYCLERNCFCH